MHYLLSNDDGYQAIGLRELARAIAKIGDITVVAPERDQSGVSHSLTLNAPLRTHYADNGFIYVNGTPADCIHLAITGLLNQRPDMVLSGINSGANLGDDVLYSGTVAAAMEARFLGCPAMAISLANCQPRHFDTAISVVLEIIKLLRMSSLKSGVLLNINIPDIPLAEINKLEVTRLGSRHKSQPVIEAKDPRGKPIYWVGAVGKAKDSRIGTDFFAIKNNNVSITPLHTDLTKYNVMEDVTECFARECEVRF